MGEEGEFKGGFEVYNVELHFLDDNIRTTIKEMSLLYRLARTTNQWYGFMVIVEDLIDLLIPTNRFEIVEIERYNQQLSNLYGQLQQNGIPGQPSEFTKNLRAFKQKLYLDLAKKQLLSRETMNIGEDGGLF